MVAGLLLVLQLTVAVAEPAERCRALEPTIEQLDLSGVPAPRLEVNTSPWLAWRTDMLKVVPRKEAPSGVEVIKTARDFLGTPYVWGGIGKGGYDCSGFVNKVFAENGYDIPRVSRDQFKVGVKTRGYDLDTGDLVFFVSKPGETRISHVGIYVGDDEFIHAAAGKGRVTFDRLSTRYYSSRFAGGRRVLSLPPGRYSSRLGTAPKNMLFEGSNSVPANWDPFLSELGLHGSGDSGGLSGGTILTEHAGEVRPLQFTSSFLKGAVTHLGPALLTPEQTAVGFRMGGGSMNRSSAMVLSPEFSYFGHGNAFQFSLAAPFRVPIGTGERPASDQWKDGWTTGLHYTKVLRELKFGQKESSLYVDFSRTLSGTLGHGQIMRYFTPNVVNDYFPEYDVRPDRPDKLSLSFDTYGEWAGTEIFVDDVMDPHVFGALAFIRPSVLSSEQDGFLKRLSLGLTYAVDRDAPYQRNAETGEYSHRSVHALGLDAEMKLFRTDNLDIKPYVDLSGLFSEVGGGVGGAIGTLVRANVTGRTTHVFRLRFEARLSQASYIPSYFDMTYSLYRWRFPVDGAGDSVTPKLALLEELQNETIPRWGVYSEFIYRLHRKLAFLVSYEDTDTVGDESIETRFSGRNFTMMGQVRDLYLPGSRKALSFYLAYHLRNIKAPKPTLSPDNPHEYFYAALSMQVWRYISVDASVRKALTLAMSDAQARKESGLDGVLGMSLRYEL
jgi:cell wall-associated NlpC family hydrolase